MDSSALLQDGEVYLEWFDLEEGKWCLSIMPVEYAFAAAISNPSMYHVLDCSCVEIVE